MRLTTRSVGRGRATTSVEITCEVRETVEEGRNKDDPRGTCLDSVGRYNGNINHVTIHLENSWGNDR